MSGIFINYRRQDAQHHANLLYDALSERYGDDRVFKDVDTIEIGRPWSEAIEAAVQRCDVMLVLIGPQWLNAGANGGRRLDEPNDYVRKEIEAALRRRIRVIPVVVDGTKMPAPEELPEGLRQLSEIQAFEITGERWRADKDELIRRLDRVLEPAFTRARAGDGAWSTNAPPPPQFTARPPGTYPGPSAPEKDDPTKQLVTWGWILTAVTLLIPLAVIGAAIVGAMVITRGKGDKTGTGVAIIIVAVLVSFFSFAFWMGA